MKWRSVFIDPSFWILLGVNVWMVYSYEQNPQIFTTLIWLYWTQSVLYGLFNFLDMETVRKADMTGMDLKSLTDKTGKQAAHTAGWFFLFHYGGFHFAYFIYLVIVKHSGPFDWDMYKKVVAAFLVLQIINFVQHKIQDRTRPANISKMFVTPYLRVVPMHLCILLPAFFHWTNLTVFLVLKIITDMIMYVVTNGNYKKDVTIADATSVNMESTISS